MADHARTQIVAAFISALTGLSTTGARVFDSDVYPIDAADLPGLLVFWTSETSTPETIGDTAGQVLELSVVAVAASATDLRATLDQVCKELQTALATSPPSLGGRSHITRTGADFERGRAEKPTGQITTHYTVTYYTAESAPDVLI